MKHLFFKHQLIFSVLLQFCFWMLFFVFNRLLFLIWHFSYLQDVDFLSFVSVFAHAFKLDVSATAYILIIPTLILITQSFYSPKFLVVVNKVYTFLVLLLISMIYVVELGVYSEWKTKLHFKALLYLAHPEEIAGTAPTWLFILLLSVFLIQFTGFYLLYVKVFFVKIIQHGRKWITGIIILIILPLLIITAARGGLQQIPINQSECYFSEKDILNLAAVNSAWNLSHSILNNSQLAGGNPYMFYEKDSAERTIRELFEVGSDSTELFLLNQRPNIVMFILEGWSADLIESQGGEPGITPFFHELEKEGILFTNIYSSGMRSQQGMSAIFSAFPAHPLTTITEQPEKYNKLPGLTGKLSKQGYYTSYYFGGQLIYGNLKSYIIFNGFDKVVEGNDFPSSFPRGKLGIHDEYTLPFFLKELNISQSPFFSCIFTMSTHSPYDMDMNEPIQWPEFEKKYVNAAHYADGCIRNFFTEAKKEKWYKNTLFILVSDHSHASYRNHDVYAPEYHKIVFLMCGDVIRPEFRGRKHEVIGSQTDLAATLSAQLGLNHEEFEWSKDLMNPNINPFAYYAFEEGFGWVSPGVRYVYDARIKRDYILETETDSFSNAERAKKNGKSYLQTVFQRYMDY